MGSLSDFAELELLDHVFNVAYVRKATVYLALCTAAVVDADDGAAMDEATGVNYARVAIAFGAAAARKVTQDGDVEFPTAGAGGWGTASHWAVMDGDTEDADEVLAHGAFVAGKTINEGNTPTVPSAEIYVEYSAGEISTYLANKLLDHMFRNTEYAKPATWVALTDEVIADGDTDINAKEPTGVGSYARKQVNINGGAEPTWDIASGTTPAFVDNTHAITFVQATASWGTITSVGICDGETGGNVLFYDNTMTDQDVGDGDTAEFPIGDLDIQMS